MEIGIVEFLFRFDATHELFNASVPTNGCNDDLADTFSTLMPLSYVVYTSRINIRKNRFSRTFTVNIHPIATDKVLR